MNIIYLSNYYNIKILDLNFSIFIYQIQKLKYKQYLDKLTLDR